MCAAIRMKARPEFQEAFSSISLYYRILHILETQRYRLPVRRFILELFDIPLDANVLKELLECGKSLQPCNATSSPKTAKLKPRVVSMFGRPARGRRSPVSDGEDDLDVVDEEEGEEEVERPVSLRPVKRVVGFLGPESP